MKKYINKGDRIEIIMPPLIGDCIMTFPLINNLKLEYEINLVCNNYVFETIKYLQEPIKSKQLIASKYESYLIIDFLSNKESAKYIRNSNTKLTIGFNDGLWNYNLILRQPKDFKDSNASEIYTYALTLLGIIPNKNIDFSGSKKWKFNKQSEILIAPGAGYLNRCFSIDQFLRLISNLKYDHITIILGPKDFELNQYIPPEFKVKSTKNIKETISILSEAKMVIASEGGFMHIAASYGIPLIGLFNIANVVNWFPYKSKYQIGIGEGKDNYRDVIENEFDMSLVIETTTLVYESIEN